jgi:glutamate synthase (NADPH/NADH) small chain
MGKVTGFLEIDRQTAKYQPASDRIRHFREFTIRMSDQEVQKQAARCMDCGIPYCHGPTGCPVNNQIPDWNDLVYNNNWERRSATCIRPTTSRNSPAASARRRARKPAR